MDATNGIKSIVRMFLIFLLIYEFLSLIPLFVISIKASHTGELKYIIDSMLFIKRWLLAQIAIWPLSLITTALWEWNEPKYI